MNEKTLIEQKLEALQKHIDNGVVIENPLTVTIEESVVIEKGVLIRSGSILTGNTIIKENAIVGPNTEIHNSTILEGALVRHSVVYDSTIGKNAQIGPFTHIRMNSVIGDDDRVGNYVEVKNSNVGYKTNISHLTYVGDTDCGNGVNFGCGTVTVNYDGKHKHRTTIGNNVFIGCNSNLIAPVTLEDETVIAAGSTITDNVESGDMAIARARQVNKKGYAKRIGYKKV